MDEALLTNDQASVSVEDVVSYCETARCMILGVMLLRVGLAALLTAPSLVFAADLEVSRRGFLIGMGATGVIAVAPKKILTAQPNFVVGRGVQNAWLFSAKPGPPTITFFDQILQHSPYMMKQLSPELSDEAIAGEVQKLRSLWETRGFILPRRWEPVEFQERSGGWFEGFGRALSRKNFRALSDLMGAKKGEVTQHEVQQIIAADEPVCDANLNTPLLNQPLFIQEDEN